MGEGLFGGEVGLLFVGLEEGQTLREGFVLGEEVEGAGEEGGEWEVLVGVGGGDGEAG